MTLSEVSSSGDMAMLHGTRFRRIRRIANSALCCSALLAFGAATAQAAGETAQQAREWLQRMAESLATLNYDAQFLHVVGSRTENMRIVHRVADNETVERLVSLDGSGRELVRTPKELIRYLPDRRTVVVEQRPVNSSLLTTVPTYTDQLETYYALSSPGRTRILGRFAQVVIVQPRDQLRYGYRLWLDDATALPLKSQVCDGAGRVIEQIVFSQLSTPANIEPAEVQPTVSTEGYRWVRQGKPGPNEAGIGAWVVSDPPQGFRITVTRVQRIAGVSAPVQHLVLSDGLVSVSVFIEPKSADSQTSTTAELARVGSALAYSTESDAYRITAVGEVPAATLRQIANSLREQTR